MSQHDFPLDPQNLGLVPMVIEQTSRGERSFDIYSRLLKERVIFHRRSDRGSHGESDCRASYCS